jgi:hypothetical protein
MFNCLKILAIELLNPIDLMMGLITLLEWFAWSNKYLAVIETHAKFWLVD